MQQYGATKCTVVHCNAQWCAVVQCGAVWSSVVQCGAVWCSVVWCSVVEGGRGDYLSSLGLELISAILNNYFWCVLVL